MDNSGNANEENQETWSMMHTVCAATDGRLAMDRPESRDITALPVQISMKMFHQSRAHPT